MKSLSTSCNVVIDGQANSSECHHLLTAIIQPRVLSTAVEMINQLASTALSLTATHSFSAAASSAASDAQLSCYLLVIEETQSFLYPLPNVGEVVIGRAVEADLRLSGLAASRRHARLRATTTGLECEDLGSHNGTSINGERLHGVRVLLPGDTISICGAQLVLYRCQQRAPALEVRTQTELRLQLLRELERCRLYRSSLAVAYVELGKPAAPTELRCALFPSLRATDFVASSGTSSALWLLLPARSDAEVLQLLTDLLTQLRELAPLASAGYAMCPGDGSDADALLHGARSCGTGKEKVAGSIFTPRDTPPTRQIGSTEIIVADNAMTRIYDLVERLAAADLPVLIHGETGAGKDVVARALHAGSARRSKRFVALNCAALQDTLLESELFGHERGAFSGAIATKPGLVELADGGTLFLDEVAELSEKAQTKLLRVLESKKVVRVGGTQERNTDARIVAATHADLEQRVKEGRFRSDLFYRLRHARVVLPPLRARPRELPYLARAFLAEFAAKKGAPALAFSDEVMVLLQSYGWPGNVRELRAAVEYAAATVDGPLIQAWHLPEWIAEHHSSCTAKGAPQLATPSVFRPVAEELAELERTRMQQALQKTDGVQLRAAELLQMPERTFYMKAKQYGLVPKSRPPVEA